MVASPTHAQRLFVIVNPVAGKGNSQLVRRVLERVCDVAGMTCDFYETTGYDNIAMIVQTALGRGYRTVVAAGGDGTVSAVADGLINSTTPLGILPVGTSNLVARELCIPRSLEAACWLLVNGQTTKALDVMRSHEQVFLSHVSMGLYARIVEKSSAMARRHYRKLAYFWHALPEVLWTRTWPFRIFVDSQSYQFDASFVLLANIGSIGVATKRWGPNIRPDDGIIDIMVVRLRSLHEYYALFLRILRNQHPAPNTIYLRACQSISLVSDHDLVIRADGEIIGQSHIVLEVIPSAVRIIVPDKPSELLHS